MEVKNLLAEFERRGVILWQDDSCLKFSAPLGSVTPEAIAKARGARKEILRHLLNRTDQAHRLFLVNVRDRLSPEQYEAWEERAAIMEFDGGLSREQAEKEAFKIIKEINHA